MGFMEKITGFVVHWADWAAAGYPKRSPSWVRELFEKPCKKCEFYEPEGKNEFAKAGICPPGLCGKCGCHVSPDHEEQLNALIYPTKPCPMGKFDANIDKKDDGTIF